MRAAMAQGVQQPGVPWNSTAQSFVQHQLSQVTNFWRQGRQAAFCLDVLPGGTAELKVTFQLPQASEIIPPPQSPLVNPTAPKTATAGVRPIVPLFPMSGSPVQPKFSSKRRKSYRRAVLHCAARAAVSLPPPLPGSLRNACLKVMGVVGLLPASKPLMSASPPSGAGRGASLSSPPDSVLCQPSTSGVARPKGNCEIETKNCATYVAHSEQ